MPKTILQRIDRFPPFLCRFVARDKSGQRPVTNQEIAQKSGLSVNTVSKISRLKSWASLKVEVTQAFSEACGVNLLSTSEQRRFLRRRKKVYAAKKWKVYRRFISVGINNAA